MLTRHYNQKEAAWNG